MHVFTNIFIVPLFASCYMGMSFSVFLWKSEMEHLAKIVSINYFAKCCILYVWQGFEYASELKSHLTDTHNKLRSVSQRKKRCSYRTSVSKSLFLKACNFIKRRLQHSCFPVKFRKFLRKPILKNNCKRLLLVMPSKVMNCRDKTFLNFKHLRWSFLWK